MATHPKKIIDAHCHIGAIPPWKFYDLEHPVKPTVYDYADTRTFVKRHMDYFKIERALAISNYGVPVHELSFDLNDVVLDAVTSNDRILGAIWAKHTITSFHQGLAWVAQLTMFLVLGLLVFPSQFGDIWIEGTVLALVLAFVARPIAAYVAAGRGFDLKDRTVLGWAGLRGAVPVVLATFPVLAGVANSSDFFDIVFFAVLLSTVLQGSTFEALAKRLGATADAPTLTTSALSETGTIRQLGADSVEYAVLPGDAIVDMRIRDLELPRQAVVNLIVRDEQAVPPRGSTRVHVGDTLHVLIRRDALPGMRELTDRWRTGPIGPRPRPKRIPEGHAPVFHVRPWVEERDGDPVTVTRVAGRDVVDRLRTRRDMPGALVVLDDGYYAVTGPVLALGREQLLSQWVRRKARAAPTDAERSWWEEVLGALAL